MNRPTQPTKEQIRRYMLARQADHSPPPPINEIRRQLGWHWADASASAGNPVGLQRKAVGGP
jgi:hypothetical protein